MQSNSSAELAYNRGPERFSPREIQLTLEDWENLATIPLIVAELGGTVLHVTTGNDAGFEELRDWLPGHNLREEVNVAQHPGWQMLWDDLLTNGAVSNMLLPMPQRTSTPACTRRLSGMVLIQEGLTPDEIRGYVVLAAVESAASDRAFNDLREQATQQKTTIRGIVHHINNELTLCLCRVEELKRLSHSSPTGTVSIQELERCLTQVIEKCREISNVCRESE